MTYQYFSNFKVKKEDYFFWLSEVNSERRRWDIHALPKMNNRHSKLDYVSAIQSALDCNNQEWLKQFAPHLSGFS